MSLLTGNSLFLFKLPFQKNLRLSSFKAFVLTLTFCIFNFMFPKPKIRWITLYLELDLSL